MCVDNGVIRLKNPFTEHWLNAFRNSMNISWTKLTTRMGILGARQIDVHRASKGIPEKRHVMVDLKSRNAIPRRTISARL